jgi:hypothetical protein
MSHAAVYDDHTEAEARTALLRQWGIDRTKPDARTPPPAAEEPLLRLYKNLTSEQAAAPAPYSELVYVANSVLQVSLEATAGVVADERKLTDDRFAALEKRILDANARSAIVERDCAALRGEVADLTHQLERDRASRGVRDAQELPSWLIQRKPRAAAKRKTAGKTARP